MHFVYARVNYFWIVKMNYMLFIVKVSDFFMVTIITTVLFPSIYGGN